MRFVLERSISGSNIFSGENVKRFCPFTNTWHCFILIFETHLSGRVQDSCSYLHLRYEASYSHCVFL